jgi:Ca-activated chloride channel family protein
MTDPRPHADSNPKENAKANANPKLPGSRAALVALLLAGTLALGAAARLAGTTDPTPLRRSASGSVVSLAAGLDRGSVLAGSDGLVRVELVLRGREGQDAAAPRVPTDLVVVLDRSGSMQGHPLDTALGAVRELIAGLADGDRFALVSYASDTQLDVPLETADAASRARWSGGLGRVHANGGTNLAAGLDRAHGVLAAAARTGRAPRLIVLSDGLANQGDYSLEGLRARAARAIGGEYVLSAVGIGDGFDETLMSALADAGTGNFYYLPDLNRLAGVFSDEFAAARETVARALSVRFSPAAGVRLAAAGGYPLLPDGEGDGSLRFHPGDLFAGQERRIWLTLHAPTDSAGAIALGGLRVDFSGPGGERGSASLEALPTLACVADDAAYYASFDAERYERATLSESLGQLKQSVARKVAEGRQEEAVAELEAYRSANEAVEERALGHVLPRAKAELDRLHDAVAAPAAVEPEVRNRLGKALLESGRDAQRAGAKK